MAGKYEEAELVCKEVAAIVLIEEPDVTQLPTLDTPWTFKP